MKHRGSWFIFGFITISIIFVTFIQLAAAEAWTPPIGIPAPPFGINESVPLPPNTWTKQVTGYYYIDQTHPASTDTSNPYGYPSKPRKTIPLSLPAGSYVELHNTYTNSHASPKIISFAGTARNPVFIRGVDAGINRRPMATKKWTVRGSYGIIEGIYFNNQGQSAGGLSFATGSNSDHVAIRHCEFRGDPAIRGGIGIAAESGHNHSYTVIYDVYIHDQGDPNSTFDQDADCITINARSNYIWVVDSEFYYSSGGGVQVNARSLANQETTHHIYVGRNYVHQTRQAGLFAKQSTDVIFSQNTIHDVIEAKWSGSKGLGYQYAPERVWFLFNHVYNCSYGIFAGSDNGMGSGQNIYIIGNLLHDIRHQVPAIYNNPYNPNNSWHNAAIMLAGGTNRYIINNTIWGTDAGILCPDGKGKLEIANNIIGGRFEPLGRDIFLAMKSLADASLMRQNIFYPSPVRIQWGSSKVYDLAGFKSATKKGQRSTSVNPLFVNLSKKDFSLQSTSPAINVGATHPVYSTFKSLYGIDIAKDIVGTPRPQGGKRDIGAYEFTTLP
jgi:hypothetical protein